MKVNWISVEDRLPDPFVSVFVSGMRVENTFVESSRGQKKLIDSKFAPFVSQDFMNSDRQWDFYDDITHWAEIEYPDPPEDNKI